MEAEAKAMRRGLFASETPIYPRVWRRGARLGGDGGGGDDTGGSVGTNSAIVILALLPNPSGSDTGNETVILGNQSSTDRSLDGWTIIDDDGGLFSLNGRTIPARGSLTVTLDSSLQLGNSGDKVTLRSTGGSAVQTIEYGSAQNGRFVAP